MEWLSERMSRNEFFLTELLDAEPVRFTDDLRYVLPASHGLYAISKLGGLPGEFLHVGKSKDGKNGLRGRIWEQHFQTGGSSGDLIEKVIAKGIALDRAVAKDWVRSNCRVQWVVEEDTALRDWAEHFLLSLLQPIWGH